MRRRRARTVPRGAKSHAGTNGLAKGYCAGAGGGSGVFMFFFLTTLDYLLSSIYLQALWRFLVGDGCIVRKLYNEVAPDRLRWSYRCCDHAIWSKSLVESENSGPIQAICTQPRITFYWMHLFRSELHYSKAEVEALLFHPGSFFSAWVNRVEKTAQQKVLILRHGPGTSGGGCPEVW